MDGRKAGGRKGRKIWSSVKREGLKVPAEMSFADKVRGKDKDNLERDNGMQPGWNLERSGVWRRELKTQQRKI